MQESSMRETSAAAGKVSKTGQLNFADSVAAVLTPAPKYAPCPNEKLTA